MQLKRLMIVLIIGVIVLVVAGVGMYNSWQTFKESSIWQSIAPTKNEYVMRDDRNNEITLDHKAKRIVVVGPNAGDIVAEIAGDAVVASTEPPLNAPDSIKDRVAANADAIANLNPDVVFVESLDDNQRLIESIQKEGLKTVVLKHPTSVKDVREQLLKIGPFLGRQSKAELAAKSLMNYVRDTESLKFSHRDEPKQIVAVYRDNHLYGRPESLIADMLSYIDVKNAAVVAGVKSFEHGTKADLIKANPDVIIVPVNLKDPDYNRDAALNSLYNDPDLANVKAIKDKRVEVISEQPVLSKTYPIGLGMYNMAQIVYKR